MEKIKIKHVGFDSWDREVFQTQKGTYVVDISLDYSHQNMRLCRSDWTKQKQSSRKKSTSDERIGRKLDVSHRRAVFLL